METTCFKYAAKSDSLQVKKQICIIYPYINISYGI